ncbi:MbtH family NRPS accessory protein [Streptomyces sp. NPDC000410]|uniref:MbtH family NRPS accessory protein n=1 Tax=Streptomyces sp. NPDC000410 TaxID=3154254 RepID=UPI003332046E
MLNGRENAGDSYLMLVDGKGRYSLWPADAGVPFGCSVVLSTDRRREGLEAMWSHWPSMKSVTLRKVGDPAV